MPKLLKTTFLGLSFLFFISLCFSDTLNIKRIELTGNHHLKSLAKLLDSKIGSTYDSLTLISDKKLIQLKYAEIGFFWVEVNYQVIPKSEGLFLRWEIIENNQAQIEKIEISGNENISSNSLLEKLKFSKGPFTEQTVKENIKSLLETYLDSGFPFCQIEPQNFQIQDTLVSYVLKIQEGPKVIIKDIEFIGSLSTRPSVLKRILGFASDQLYSETKLKTGIRRLDKTNLFDILEYDIISKTDEYFIRLEVAERKSNEIQAAFAFLPKVQDRPAEYSGLALVSIRNLLGTMRQIRGSWSKNIYRTNFGLFYLEPFIFGFGMNLGGEVNHETRDTTYAKTNFNIFTDISVQDNLILRFESGYELVVPGIGDIERIQTYWAGNGISIDSRDKSINPRKGIYAMLTNRIGRKMIKYQAAHLVAKTYFDSELILPFTNKFNLTFLLNGRNLYTSDTVNFYDLFYLGGSRTLRGYQEEAFSSTRLLWLNNELRWLLGNESRFFPFYDIGVFRKDQQYETKMSYGLGLRVGSRIGLFGIDYGLAFGENPLNGKVHLSLISQF